MAIAKCSHCQAPFERLFKFCPNCGLSVIGDEFSDKSGVAIHDLFEIARSFAAVTDLDLLLKKISAAAEKLTQAEASAVMLLDDNKEFLFFKSAGGEKGNMMKTIRIPIGQGIAGLVAQNGQSLIIDDVTKDSRFLSSLGDEKSGFKTRSILCVPMNIADEIIGVMEVVNKKNSPEGKFSSEDQEILGSLAGFAAVSILNSKLNLDQKNFFANIIEILISSVENISKQSHGHCWRVAQNSCAIARRLKITGEAYKTIYYGSLLHDIGYIQAHKQINSKKVAMFEEPQDKIEHLHPWVGAEMAESISLFKRCAPLIRAHHEHWDGTGFPNKLKGEEIPLGARIICLAETVEDLRSHLMTEEEFRKHVEQYVYKNSDKFFDPQVATAYLEELNLGKEAPARNPNI
ncbi:MAG: hypothetical protein A3I11_02570 [Elusimicrobia bacterium RIFCSPLOWO2_02_FULL_39_32]|nr:MAG: hypothetical protein A3B80_01375 [Elusimicrobia bacterium RIFCSPHIGHO2_02_FULL_39_36]OGR93617.1 MAG: hypothetical protein A3I11_02570 [Elusimicrobia bacterium RIFCSPLOWO2_02_FULL_39_32]